MGTSTLTSQSETWWLKVAPVEFTWLYREPTTRPGLGLHVYSAPCSGTYLQLNSHSRKQAGVINLRFEEIQSWNRTTKNLLLASRELQVRTVLVVRQLRQGDLAPQIGCEESVCFGDLQEGVISIASRSHVDKIRTAANVAFKKLPIVAVEPFDCVYTSSIPASWSSRLDAGAATIPVPRGAGMRRHMTDPTFPLTFDGTVWGSPRAAPQ